MLSPFHIPSTRHHSILRHSKAHALILIKHRAPQAFDEGQTSAAIISIGKGESLVSSMACAAKLRRSTEEPVICSPLAVLLARKCPKAANGHNVVVWRGDDDFALSRGRKVCVAFDPSRSHRFRQACRPPNTKRSRTRCRSLTPRAVNSTSVAMAAAAALIPASSIWTMEMAASLVCAP